MMDLTTKEVTTLATYEGFPDGRFAAGRMQH